MTNTTLTIKVPTSLPTNERADYLRDLYNAHVRPVKPGDHWKAECAAVVPAQLSADVHEAMDFMGSIVDDVRVIDRVVVLYSRGYWAHGF